MTVDRELVGSVLPACGVIVTVIVIAAIALIVVLKPFKTYGSHSSGMGRAFTGQYHQLR